MNDNLIKIIKKLTKITFIKKNISVYFLSENQNLKHRKERNKRFLLY